MNTKRTQLQCNNLTAKRRQELWKVFSPDGVLLQEFRNRKDAVQWMRSTYDFCKRKHLT